LIGGPPGAFAGHDTLLCDDLTRANHVEQLATAARPQEMSAQHNGSGACAQCSPSNSVQTDGRTDMTALMVAFHAFCAKWHKFDIKATGPQDVEWINVAYDTEQWRDGMPKVTYVRGCMKVGVFIG